MAIIICRVGTWLILLAPPESPTPVGIVYPHDHHDHHDHHHDHPRYEHHRHNHPRSDRPCLDHHRHDHDYHGCHLSD